MYIPSQTCLSTSKRLLRIPKTPSFWEPSLHYILQLKESGGMHFYFRTNLISNLILIFIGRISMIWKIFQHSYLFHFCTFALIPTWSWPMCCFGHSQLQDLVTLWSTPTFLFLSLQELFRLELDFLLQYLWALQFWFIFIKKHFLF